MKKLILTTLAVILIFPLFAQNNAKVQNSAKEEQPATTGNSDKSKEQRFNGWSISISGGMDILDGDCRKDNLRFFPNSEPAFSFLGQVEYMINPYWGLALEYGYSPMRGYMTQEGTENGYNFKTLANDITLQLNLNLLNLFNSYRKKTRWNLFLEAGYGVSIYNVSKQYDDTPDQWEKSGTKYASIVPIGLSVEYEATRWLGVFLEGKYKMYMVDDLDGYGASHFSRSNDNLGYIGVGLRYKIVGSAKKGYRHMRNISPAMRNPIPTTALSDELQSRLDEMDNNIAQLETVVNTTIPAEIEKTNEEVATLRQSDAETKEDVSALRDEMAQRTVPQGATQTTTVTTTTVTTTPPSTPVEERPILIKPTEIPQAQHHTLQTNTQNQPAQTAQTTPQTTPTSQQQSTNPAFIIPSIYYALNAYNITEYGMMILADIANKMHSNPGTMLEILSFCDNSGNVEYNNKLSNLRASTIKDTLINEFGIAEERITITNKGKTEGVKDYLMSNRRCDFILR